jgi:DNA mismatch endonuclease (patch repair protein)
VKSVSFKRLRTSGETGELVRRQMQANRSKNTKPELALRRALWAAGVRGYRKHRTELPGKPDLVWPGKRVAVFLNGCFWHRCPVCEERGKVKPPKTNSEYWSAKRSRNEERQAAQLSSLQEAGWRTVVVWECELKASPDEAVERIRAALRAG